jgi:hypothetical protein
MGSDRLKLSGPSAHFNEPHLAPSAEIEKDTDTATGGEDAAFDLGAETASFDEGGAARSPNGSGRS